MANVGYATLQVIPSMKGIGPALTSGVSGPASAAGATAGSKFGGSMLAGVKKFVGPLAAIGAASAAVGFLKGAISGASDLNETVSKSNAIFGENSNVIRAWASDAATNLGLSESAALNAASGFGDMFLQLGFAGDVATQMSKNVVGLSADLGSFNNLPTADVSQRIAAAFRGEYDSLQALIPNINAARVQSEAFAMTGKTVASELTAQEKAAAVLAIVTKDGTRAIGDFERTSSGAANTSKILGARFEDLKTRVGQALLPAFQAVLGVAGKVLTFFTTGGDKTSAFGKILAWLGGTARSVFAGIKAFLADNQARFAKWAATVKRLFDQVAPVVIGMFNDLRVIIPKVAEVVGAVLGKAFAFLGAAVAKVVEIITAVVRFFRENEGAAVALRAVIVGVGAAFLAYKTAMLAVAVATKIVSAVTKAFAAVQGALNAVMAMNPIALVVLALVALAAGLVYAYKNSETFRDIVDGVWKAVSGFIKGAWENVIKPVIDALVAAFTWVVTSAQALGAAVAAVWEWVKQTTSAAWELLKSTISTAIDAVKEKISAVLTAIRVAWSIAWNAVKSFLSGIWEGIKSIAGNAIDIVLGWISGLLGRIEDVKDALFGIGGGIGGGLLGGGGVTGGQSGGRAAGGSMAGDGAGAQGGVNLNVTKHYAGRISAFEEAQEDSRDIAWARALA